MIISATHLSCPRFCKSQARLLAELSVLRGLSSVENLVNCSFELSTFRNFRMSSNTSDRSMSTRMSNNISVVVSVHSLNSSMVGFSIFSSWGIIFEKPSLDATFVQSQPDLLRGSSGFENSFWSSQLKSFTFGGRSKSYAQKRQRSKKWRQCC